MVIRYKGSVKMDPPPEPTPAPEAPTPPSAIETDEELKAKRDQAVADEKVRLQQKRGYGRTVATSPIGVLGKAPTNQQELKPTLG